MKDYTGYINHLKASRDYWIMIAAAEKEKNIKLEKIIRKVEEKIYGINELTYSLEEEGDK